MYLGKEENYDLNLTMGNDLEGLVKLHLDSIYNFFMGERDMFPHIGLLSAESGVTLFLAECCIIKEDERCYAKMSEHLSFLIDTLNSQSYSEEKISPYFSNGLAGFGWLLCHLLENNLMEFSEDYFMEIDSILKDHLITQKEMTWDILHGRLGIVRYFLVRKKYDVVQSQLELLASEVQENEIEFKLISTRPDTPPFYDCGLAHGMAGILYVLGKSYELGICQKICKKMGGGIMNFYANVEQNFSVVGSYYPYQKPVSSYHKGNEQKYSRLAWCYGDLGVLYSMFLYYKRLDDHENADKIGEKLRLTAMRREIEANDIRDAGLCHGAAGIAHIYNRLYKMTGEDIFQDSAIYWLDITTRISYDDSVSPPFRFFFGDSQKKKENGVYQECYGLLEGLLGVGLVFLSAMNPKHSNWDEVIMLY